MRFSRYKNENKNPTAKTGRKLFDGSIVRAPARPDAIFARKTVKKAANALLADPLCSFAHKKSP